MLDGRKRSWIVEGTVFGVLWLVYFGFGLWARRQFPLDAVGAIHGWDFNGLAEILSDYRSLSFIRFRHPAFGFFLVPIPLLLGRVAQLNYMFYWGCLSFIFAGFTTVGVWLVYRVSLALDGVGRGVAAFCTAAFASFAYVRYMAVGPESYPISMALALAALLWILYTRCHGVAAKLDVVVWCALFFFAGGMTITQGAKIVLAYLVTHRLTRRAWGWLIGGGGAVFAFGTVFYVLKLVVFGDGGRTIESAFRELWAVVPQGIGWGERLRMLEMFFFEPIIPHGVPYVESKIVVGYAGWWQYVVCGVLYLVAAFGAWRLRHAVLMRVMAAMASIDVVIHLVFFWGMEEAQIYCGHWFYLLPILWAAAFARRGEVGRGEEEGTRS